MVFLLIGAAGTLAKEYLGRFGFLLVSGIGGLVSSASTTAAAANMVHHSKLTPTLGGIGVVVASAASAFIQAIQYARFRKRSQRVPEGSGGCDHASQNNGGTANRLS